MELSILSVDVGLLICVLVYGTPVYLATVSHHLIEYFGVARGKDMPYPYGTTVPYPYDNAYLPYGINGWAFLVWALSTAVSTICWPIRHTSIDSGPCTGAPVLNA